MGRGLAWILAAVGFGLMAGATDGSAADHKFVGAKKCSSCHKKELIGNQYGEWQKGKHSKAYETLKGEKAAEIAKEKGITGPAYEAEDCLRCHVTAYGADPSAFAKKRLKASDGVQCESCHGPGKDYTKKKTMSDRDKAMANGLWEPGKDEKVCTACHNDESPSWDSAKGFDFEEAKKVFTHPIPEDVKGNYLALAKKLRAEKGKRGKEEEEEDEE